MTTQPGIIQCQFLTCHLTVLRRHIGARPRQNSWGPCSCSTCVPSHFLSTTTKLWDVLRNLSFLKLHNGYYVLWVAITAFVCLIDYCRFNRPFRTVNTIGIMKWKLNLYFFLLLHIGFNFLRQDLAHNQFFDSQALFNNNPLNVIQRVQLT